MNQSNTATKTTKKPKSPLAASILAKAKPARLNASSLKAAFKSSKKKTLTHNDLKKMGYGYEEAYAVADKAPRVFSVSYSKVGNSEPTGEISLQSPSLSKATKYKGQGLAGTSLYIDKIASPEIIKSPYSPKITITLSNGGNDLGENSILVDVKCSGNEGYTQPQAFQFVAGQGKQGAYEEAFKKLAACFADWSAQTSYDPLQ